MRQDVLIVGEAPSRRSDPERPLDGRSGVYLAKLCGLPGSAYQHWPTVNLFHHRPDRQPTVAEWRAAGHDTLAVVHHQDPDLVVLLGAKTAVSVLAAAGHHGVVNPLTPVHTDNRDWLPVPHPSGLNRYWNDPHRRAHAATILRSHLCHSNAT